MPIDFRNYQDPGVYVEAVPVPVLDIAGLEPTIVALVGISQGSQTQSGGAFIYNSQPTNLTGFIGIDASTLQFSNSRSSSSYYSSVIGRVIKESVGNGAFLLGTDPNADIPEYITPYIDLPVWDGTTGGGTAAASGDREASTIGRYNIIIGSGPSADTATLTVLDNGTWELAGLAAEIEVGQLISLDRTYRKPEVAIAKTGSPSTNINNADWIARPDGTWDVKLYSETLESNLPNIFHVTWEDSGNIGNQWVSPTDTFKLTLDLSADAGQYDPAQESQWTAGNVVDGLITIGSSGASTIDADLIAADIGTALDDILLEGQLETSELSFLGFGAGDIARFEFEDELGVMWNSFATAAGQVTFANINTGGATAEADIKTALETIIPLAGRVKVEETSPSLLYKITYAPEVTSAHYAAMPAGIQSGFTATNAGLFIDGARELDAGNAVTLAGSHLVYDVNEYGFSVDIDSTVSFDVLSPFTITSQTLGAGASDADHAQVTRHTTIDSVLTVPDAGFTFLQFGNGPLSSNERVKVLEVVQTGAGWQVLNVQRAQQGSIYDRATPLNTNVYHVPYLDADIQVALVAGYDTDLTTNVDNWPVIEILDDTVRTPRITATSTLIHIIAQISPDAYYAATPQTNLQDIQEKYGFEWSQNGKGAILNSPLTQAANLAIANGASQLVTLAVEPDIDGDYTYDQWEKALKKLSFNPEVNLIVPLIDIGSDLGASVIDFLRFDVKDKVSEGILRRVLVGMDGLAFPYSGESFAIQAQQLNDERFSVVAPGFVTVRNGTNNGTTAIPGYFMAAAISGIQSIIAPQEPLTRKQMYGAATLERLSSTDAIDMQSNGVIVVWQDRFNRLIIKHGLTTDMSNVYTRESSIITARDRLRDLIYDTLDKGHLIGSGMTVDTPNQVMGGVTAALDSAQTTGLIFDYSDVVYRINKIEPTAIEIRFAYKPTLPLNYIVVEFHIDTTVGTLEFQSLNSGAPTNTITL